MEAQEGIGTAMVGTVYLEAPRSQRKESRIRVWEQEPAVQGFEMREKGETSGDGKDGGAGGDRDDDGWNNVFRSAKESEIGKSNQGMGKGTVGASRQNFSYKEKLYSLGDSGFLENSVSTMEALSGWKHYFSSYNEKQGEGSGVNGGEEEDEDMEEDSTPHQTDRPFRFLPSWVLHEEFDKFLHDQWNNDGMWEERVEEFAAACKSWNKKVFSFTSGGKKRKLLNQLHGITKVDQRYGLTLELENLQHQLWSELENLLMQESLMWAKKAQCKLGCPWR